MCPASAEFERLTRGAFGAPASPMANEIDTDELSERYRAKAIRLPTRELLISRLAGSEQEADFTLPPNCDGFGRVRHFRLAPPSPRWVVNPLPILPASKALGLPVAAQLRAQAFQNAVCNWRCWYCYVPFNLLAADEARSAWLTPDRLIAQFADLVDRPNVIDLTGGQPDLVPEWVPWTMSALEQHGLQDQVYLWSDDNLSNDYFWRFLSTEDIDRIAQWKNYGRVCCFKGFDGESFAFNTGATSDLFERQFELFRRFNDLGLDLYAYVTLTAEPSSSVSDGVRRFVDRLQQIDENLPLRTVPLEISVFTPVRSRLNMARSRALSVQYEALDAFRLELERRYSSDMRDLAITEVPLRGRTCLSRGVK